MELSGPHPAIALKRPSLWPRFIMMTPWAADRSPRARFTAASSFSGLGVILQSFLELLVFLERQNASAHTANISSGDPCHQSVTCRARSESANRNSFFDHGFAPPRQFGCHTGSVDLHAPRPVRCAQRIWHLAWGGGCRP